MGNSLLQFECSLNVFVLSVCVDIFFFCSPSQFLPRAFQRVEHFMHYALRLRTSTVDVFCFFAVLKPLSMCFGILLQKKVLGITMMHSCRDMISVSENCIQSTWDCSGNCRSSQIVPKSVKKQISVQCILFAGKGLFLGPKAGLRSWDNLLCTC